jgi:hypothetical protein
MAPATFTRYTGRQCCYTNHPSKIVGTVHGLVAPTCPEGIADIAGVTVADLPIPLQHWYTDEPYTGNSILDRLDPQDWVLKNPWKDLTLRVTLTLCRTCFHKRRKALGLPPLVLKPTSNEG